MRRHVPARAEAPLRAFLRAGRLARLALEDPALTPDLFVQYPQYARDPRIERVPGGWRYEGGFYPDYLTVGGASHAIARRALEACRGTGIDIGAGLWPLPGAVAVDVWRGPGVERLLSDFDAASVDYVFSSHCLEHIAAWPEALAEWVSKLRLGGPLFLYLPHPSCAMWWPGSAFVGDEHKWSPTPSVVKEAVTGLGLSVVDADDGPDAMMSFYVCARTHGDALLGRPA